MRHVVFLGEMRAKSHALLQAARVGTATGCHAFLRAARFIVISIQQSGYQRAVGRHMLVNLLDAGDVVGGCIDFYPHPLTPASITASVARISERAGVSIPAEKMVEILRKLFFAVERNGDTLTVTPPPYRSDVEGEADLCEEVLRIYGFDHIGCTRLRGETTQGGVSPMDIEKLDYVEAVKHLADLYHIPLPEMQNDPDYERRRSLKERIYLANQAAAKLYHQTLWEPQGAALLAYVQKRGVSDAVIRRFGIGAATGASIQKELVAQGFTEDELVAAGLLYRRDGRTGDMFRNRVMFPIIDAYGNVLGFGGRAMGDVQPKYLNTADTPAFNKRFNVFAANLLRKARSLTRVILVEGYMDVVALSQFGVEGVAATLGTALTPEQARLLGRYAPEIWLAYDGDSAGQHVKSEDLVLGDVIALEAGDSVPADARILECASMKVEEAALTGESVPVQKESEAIAAPHEHADHVVALLLQQHRRHRRIHPAGHVHTVETSNGLTYINPGSAALPKEGQPKSYMTLDWDAGLFEIKSFDGGVLQSYRLPEAQACP